MGKGAATKAAILEEALAIASQTGFETLSIGQLADAVGMSKSGLYAHFRDKEDLQLQVLHRATELFGNTVVESVREMPPGAARLKALMEGWLRWTKLQEMPGGCIFMSAAHEYQHRPGPVRDALVASQERWISYLTYQVQQAIDVGELSPTVDAEQFAYDFYALALAYEHFSGLLGDHQAEDRARAALDRLLESIQPVN
ncbi:MAG: TetR/AcrR family transcriptional regulator [Acidobacteriota bacterium]|nr:TetR/AcrR family transcriptional regulator [Acidobacteriota bacterium]